MTHAFKITVDHIHFMQVFQSAPYVSDLSRQLGSFVHTNRNRWNSQYQIIDEGYLHYFPKILELSLSPSKVKLGKAPVRSFLDPLPEMEGC